MLRDELLGEAEKLLVAGGEEAVTLRAVAAAVGVTTPNVYRHFADKSALLDEVASRAWSQLDSIVAAEAALAEDPFAALRSRGRSYITFGLAHPVHYGLLMMRRGDAGPVAVEAARQSLAHLTAGVQRCIDNGTFRGRAEDLSLGLWATVHGVVSLLIAQPNFAWPEDLDGYIDRSLRMAGLGTAVSSRLTSPIPTDPHRLASAFDRAATTLMGEDQK